METVTDWVEEKGTGFILRCVRNGLKRNVIRCNDNKILLHGKVEKPFLVVEDWGRIFLEGTTSVWNEEGWYCHLPSVQEWLKKNVGCVFVNKTQNPFFKFCSPLKGSLFFWRQVQEIQQQEHPSDDFLLPPLCMADRRIILRNGDTCEPRTYIQFPSFSAFQNWVSKELSHSKTPCLPFHEIIGTGSPVRPFLDVELSLDQIDAPLSWQFFEMSLESAVKDVLVSFYGIQSPISVVFLSGRRSKKWSHHVIVTGNLYFSSFQLLGLFARLVRHRWSQLACGYEDLVEKAIDFLYQPGRTLRSIGSIKTDPEALENHPLALWNVAEQKPSTTCHRKLWRHVLDPQNYVTAFPVDSSRVSFVELSDSSVFPEGIFVDPVRETDSSLCSSVKHSLPLEIAKILLDNLPGLPTISLSQFQSNVVHSCWLEKKRIPPDQEILHAWNVTFKNYKWCPHENRKHNHNNAKCKVDVSSKKIYLRCLDPMCPKEWVPLEP